MISVAIRRATDDEKRDMFPAIVANGPRVRVPKYVVVNPATDHIYTVFGLPQGGDTRAETLFWAERLASQNGLDFTPPAGWENVKAEIGARA